MKILLLDKETISVSGRNTLSDSTGDVAIADLVYKKAIKREMD